MEGSAGDQAREKTQGSAFNSETDCSSHLLSKLWNDLGYSKTPIDIRPNSLESERSGDNPNPRLPKIDIQDIRPPHAPKFHIPKKRPEKKFDDLAPNPEKIPPNTDSNKPIDPGTPGKDSGPGKLYELDHLKNRSADHTTADAMLRIPENFDPSKPIHLAIYNHGWGSTAQSSYIDNHLDEQMEKAPPNTVLIVPEWQKVAGARSAQQGKFQNDNLFKNMLQEVFDKTPELKGKTLADVVSIGIFTHSGGYVAAQTELYKNGLSDKVTNITLLDSLYNDEGFDPWLKQNIKDIAAGTKQFNNFFNDTNKESHGQALRVKQMLSKAGLPASTMIEDYNDGETPTDAATIASHPLVFKFSSLSVDGLDSAHLSIPHIYVGPVEAAANRSKPKQNQAH